MKKMFSILVLTLIGISAQAGQRIIGCESISYQPNACAYASGPGTTVSLMTVLSNTNKGKGGACVFGTDWYTDGTYIHVLNGCRAQFSVITPALITPCNSLGYQPTTCTLNGGQIANVRLLSQQSSPKKGKGNCVQGVDWNFDASNIYVNNGCRATFSVDFL